MRRWPVKNLDDRIFWIDAAGFCLIGFLCMMYFMFKRSFAQMHLRLPFLDFPVFTGEIFLAFCLGLFLWKQALLGKRRLTGLWSFVMAGYLAFVLGKAFAGYAHWGPLAFRNAALFYYPLFAVLTWSFYRKEFFTTPVNVAILGLFFGAFLIGIFDHYWLFSVLMLGLILIYKIPGRLRYVLLAVFLALFEFRLLFKTARMMMVSNFVAGAFLIGPLFFIWNVNRLKKVLILTCVVLTVFLGYARIADQRSLRSILNWPKILEVYYYYNQTVQNRIPYYRPHEIEDLKVYSPNECNFIERQRKEVNSILRVIDKKRKIKISRRLRGLGAKETGEGLSGEEDLEKSLDAEVYEGGPVFRVLPLESEKLFKDLERDKEYYARLAMVMRKDNALGKSGRPDMPEEGRQIVDEQTKTEELSAGDEDDATVTAGTRGAAAGNILEEGAAEHREEEARLGEKTEDEVPLTGSLSETAQVSISGREADQGKAEDLSVQGIEKDSVASEPQIEGTRTPSAQAGPGDRAVEALDTVPRPDSVDRSPGQRHRRAEGIEKELQAGMKQEAEASEQSNEASSQDFHLAPAAHLKTVRHPQTGIASISKPASKKTFSSSMEGLPSKSPGIFERARERIEKASRDSAEKPRNRQAGRIKAEPSRPQAVYYTNVAFRLFIWKDMINEFWHNRPFPYLGFMFGKPLRSISLEVLGWGTGEWRRDGWVAAHNSFLHILYRSGLVGLFGLLVVFGLLLNMIGLFLKKKSLIGVMLSAAVINWFVAANFLVVLEVPYTAIPIWTIYGLTFARYRKLMNEEKIREKGFAS